MYLSAGEDSIGQTHITSVCILYEETEQCIQWYCDILSEFEPILRDRLCSIVTDKDEKLRKCLRKSFPKSSLMLCKFHVMQNFQRTITTNKMKITKKIRHEILKVIQAMIYCENLSEFTNHINKIYSFNIVRLTEYFKNNWECNYSEWVLGLSDAINYYGNGTNNRIESINSKIKMVVTKFSTLEQFVDKFFKLLKSLRIEREVKTISQLYYVSNTLLDSTATLYSDHLTKYAFELVQEQIKIFQENNVFVFTGNVTPQSCTCSFFKSYNLPCSHVLTCRSAEKLNLFSETLYDERWTKAYCVKYTQVGSVTKSKNEMDETILEKKTTRPIKSFSEKLKHSSIFTSKLPATTSEFCGDFFSKSIKSIKLLENIIKSHRVEFVDSFLDTCIF